MTVERVIYHLKNAAANPGLKETEKRATHEAIDWLRKFRRVARGPVSAQLREFLQDEMSKTTDIMKLRKLALCRLGDPRYKDYRRKYFDEEGR
jgi:hypothetical protein